LTNLIFINSGFVTNTLYAGVKNFVSERTRNKFVFAQGTNYLDSLLPLIDRDQIPKDYGGDGLWLDEVEM
jgi:hypothetical protein